MHKTSPAIAPEGLPFIGFAAFGSFIFALLGWWVPALLFLLATGFCAWFFRDPERATPMEVGLAVAPADGKVVKVGRAVDPVTGQERPYIAIFMNVFNVHVNRAPVAGKILSLRHHPGAFFNASLDKASEKNERLNLHMADEDGHAWTVVQIAGLIARRIVCRAQVGDQLGRGERFGLIRFGSRLDVYLPETYSPMLQVGDKTVAGQTVLAAQSTRS